jgi:hypothetical protein
MSIWTWFKLLMDSWPCYWAAPASLSGRTRSPSNFRTPFAKSDARAFLRSSRSSAVFQTGQARGRLGFCNSPLIPILARSFMPQQTGNLIANGGAANASHQDRPMSDDWCNGSCHRLDALQAALRVLTARSRSAATVQAKTNSRMIMP